MKMYIYGADQLCEIENFVNANGIKIENIVDIMQTSDGDFQLIYYAD